MQTVKIPVSIDPNRAAMSKLCYKGLIANQRLTRLNALCGADCSDVAVSFECNVDIQGIVYLKGQAVTKLSFICQRCMGLFTTEVKVDFCFSPCENKAQVDELPSTYEAIECDDNGEIRLHQLIEDEFIIAMPLVPMHSDDSCHQGDKDVVVGEIELAQQQRPNPFAVLDKLKSK